MPNVSPCRELQSQIPPAIKKGAIKTKGYFIDPSRLPIPILLIQAIKFSLGSFVKVKAQAKHKLLKHGI